MEGRYVKREGFGERWASPPSSPIATRLKLHDRMGYRIRIAGRGLREAAATQMPVPCVEGASGGSDVM